MDSARWPEHPTRAVQAFTVLKHPDVMFTEACYSLRRENKTTTLSSGLRENPDVLRAVAAQNCNESGAVAFCCACGPLLALFTRFSAIPLQSIYIGGESHKP